MSLGLSLRISDKENGVPDNTGDIVAEEGDFWGVLARENGRFVKYR